MILFPNYRRAGVGPTLVLVHGYFGGSAQWCYEINALKSSFDIIAVDLPGFGESCDKQSFHSIKDFANSVIALIDKLDVDEFILLGHSMGGMIAQEIAYLAQPRIKKLVLYGTGPIGFMPNRFETHEQSRQRLKRDGLEVTAKRIVAKWFLKGSEAEEYNDCVSLALMAGIDSGIAGLNAMETWDGREQLKYLNQPAQIIWGEYDRSYGFSEQKQLWDGLPNASLAVVSRASHLVHLEKPAIFMLTLKDFLYD